MSHPTEITYTNVDGIAPTVIVEDPYVPADQVWASNGVMMVPTWMAKNFPPFDTRVVVGEGKFKGWSVPQ